MKYLYVTWDGPQASYLESLFLPIFERLGAYGVGFDVLQFTWDIGDRATAAAEACRRAGIGYGAVEVNRGWGGAGPLLSAVFGARHVLKHLHRSGADAILARSTMPAIATMRAARSATFPFVFDADGLPLDERVDFAGLRPDSLQYRLLRDAEAQMLHRSAAVLVRTVKAREIMVARAGAGTDPAKFHIVANGRDPGVFHPGDEERRSAVREQLQIPLHAPLLGYAGSVGPQYMFPEMLGLLGALRRREPDSRLLILTASPDAAREAIAAFAAGQAEACHVSTAGSQEVSKFLAACDVGLALRRTSFSMQGVAPIKIGEYLLSGVPVIGTAGVGEVDRAIEDGVFLPFDDDGEQIERAVDWILEMRENRDAMRTAARDFGVDNISVGSSVEQYRKALAMCPAAISSVPRGIKDRIGRE